MVLMQPSITHYFFCGTWKILNVEAACRMSERKISFDDMLEIIKNKLIAN